MLGLGNASLTEPLNNERAEDSTQERNNQPNPMVAKFLKPKPGSTEPTSVTSSKIVSSQGQFDDKNKPFVGMGRQFDHLSVVQEFVAMLNSTASLQVCHNLGARFALIRGGS